MSIGRAAVILQRAKDWIDTRQVAWLVEAASVIAVEVKASRDKFARLGKAFVAIFGKRS
jgi:hypothetical protein